RARFAGLRVPGDRLAAVADVKHHLLRAQAFDREREARAGDGVADALTRDGVTAVKPEPVRARNEHGAVVTVVVLAVAAGDRSEAPPPPDDQAARIVDAPRVRRHGCASGWRRGRRRVARTPRAAPGAPE